MKKHKIVLLVAGIVVVVGALSAWVWFNRPQSAYIVSGIPDGSGVVERNGDVLVGMGPTVVQRLLHEFGYSINAQYLGNDEILWRDKVDILITTRKTKERVAEFVYSEPFYTESIALFINRKHPFIYKDWTSLLGKKGIAIKGVVFGQSFDDFIREMLTVSRVANISEAWDLLSSGKADYVIYSEKKGLASIGSFDGLGLLINKLPANVVDTRYYIAIRKNLDLAQKIEDIDKMIAQYKQAGVMEQSLQQ